MVSVESEEQMLSLLAAKLLESRTVVLDVVGVVGEKDKAEAALEDM
jgi:hypothetical protein